MNLLQGAQAAVALVEFHQPPRRQVLLLQRALHPQDPWSGHWAFPGGRREKHDLDLIQTCIRETREECGLQLDIKNLIQHLPLAIAGNRIPKPLVVAPYHFLLRNRPTLTLDSTEIRNCLWLDLATWRDRRRHTNLPMEDKTMPAFDLDGSWLWGFTYGVLARWSERTENQGP